MKLSREQAIETIVRIPLTRGMFAVVDESDMPLLQAYRWYAVPVGRRRSHIYAVGQLKTGGRMIRMHRLLLGVQDNTAVEVDHINFDTLDNRRSNLRVLSKAENRQHRRKSDHLLARDGKTRYKGITFHLGKWQVQCAREHVGRFVSEEEAARAYDACAIKKWGNLAVLNFPRGTE